ESEAGGRARSGLAVARSRRTDRDVEVQDVLAPAEPGVQRDGRIVAVVGLHEDDPGAAFGRDPAELRDQRGRYTPATMRRGDGEIVEVDLAALLLVLAQLVGHEAAHDIPAGERGDRDEVVAGQQASKITGTRPRGGVDLLLSESLAEHRGHRFHQR